MGLNREELSKKIGDLIKSGKEGKTWDFKEKWYKNKNDLVVTILAMANNCTSEDSYIIIGVKDQSCFPSDGPDWRDGAFKQTSELNDWLRKIPFNSFNYPDLELETKVKVRVEVDETERYYSLDVIVVKSTANVPYYLSRDFRSKKTVKEKEIYVRMKDQNVLATPPELEALYKKKFGLSLSIEERFELLLSKKDGWELLKAYSPYPEQSSIDVLVNKHCPDFTIRMPRLDELPYDERSLPTCFLLPYIFKSDGINDIYSEHRASNLPLLEFCGCVELFFKDFKVEYGRFDILSLDETFFGNFTEDLLTINNYYFPIMSFVRPQTSIKSSLYFYFVKQDKWYRINVILKHLLLSKMNNHHIKGMLALIDMCVNQHVIFFESTEEKKEFDQHLMSENINTVKILKYISQHKDKYQLTEKNLKKALDVLFEKSEIVKKAKISEKLEKDKYIKYYIVNMYIVEYFHKWKFVKLLEEKNNWKINFDFLKIDVDGLLCLEYTILNDIRCKDFSLKIVPQFYNGLSESVCFFDNFKIVAICDSVLRCGTYFQNLESHFYQFNFGVCVDVDDGNDSFGLVFPENNKHNDFPYLYFFRDSIKFKINNILLHADLTSSETSDIIKERIEKCNRIFKNCVIYFENEEEKQEFDEYLQENQNGILKKIKSFYEENRQKFEDNCRKICPKKFSSDVGTMVERGVRAEKIAEIFRGWKAGKLSQ